MSSASKIIQAAAGNAAGEGLYVEEVFSTYLYDGTGATQTITNEIDLDGEGGLVWIKARGGNFNQDHSLIDTERGHTAALASNLTSGNLSQEYALGTSGSFNSDGFTIASTNNQVNGTSPDVTGYASWTFRKAPKFFDVVTYTGTGSNRTVSHNLDSVPGMIIVKRTDTTSDWVIYHRSIANTQYYNFAYTGTPSTDATMWNSTTATSSVFSLGTNSAVNASGGTYVAYLFAHNDGDGEFGESGDQDIIKCGSFTSDGSGNATVNLGFEPQFVMFQQQDDDWFMNDVMRGMTTSSSLNLKPNSNSAESDNNRSTAPTASGFNASVGNTNKFCIYIAIRRGPMKTPESGTEVYDGNSYTGNNTSGRNITTGFVVDAVLGGPRNSAVTHIFDSRLTGGRYLETQTTSDDSPGFTGYDVQNGYLLNNTAGSGWNNSSYNYIRWAFRRAPGFFDVVAYTGTGSATTISHNLGVVPELIIVKNRDASDAWQVYAGDETDYLVLNTNAATADNVNRWNDTAPTASVFTIGTAVEVNTSTEDYIAYLFASLDGVSKVGSYTGNGTSQTIDCGFSAGARFVMTKRTNTTGNWNVWDSERGIIAGNDPRLELNTTDAEDTGHDYIDPDSSGFVVNYVADDDDDSNVSGDEYIFLAIA